MALSSVVIARVGCTCIIGDERHDFQQKPTRLRLRRVSHSPVKPIDRLLRIMARLRSRRGCPWDREQTHASIKQNLIEECYEAVEAIEARDDGALCEELGDLLLQIVFHAQMAREAGEFDFDDVAHSIADKLVRRHPHVFGRNRLKTAEQVLTQWHAIKKTEKNGRRSVLDGVPKHLPALMKAHEIQKKAARVGFDWKKSTDVLAKVEEELSELKRAMKRKRRREIEEEFGDLLFAVVNLARFQKYDAEEALNQTVKKFRRRFEQIEQEIARRGKKLEDCSLEELDAIWNRVKSTESG
jgi:tetrapyrrole methylase family protein/MazG family protein